MLSSNLMALIDMAFDRGIFLYQISCRCLQGSMSSVIFFTVLERLLISVNLVDSDVYEVIVSDRVETKLENGRVKMRGESVYRVRMSQAQYREICGATTTHEWVLLNLFQYLIEEEQFAELPASFDLKDLENKLPSFLSEIRRRIGFSD